MRAIILRLWKIYRLLVIVVWKIHRKGCRIVFSCENYFVHKTIELEQLKMSSPARTPNSAITSKGQKTPTRCNIFIILFKTILFTSFPPLAINAPDAETPMRMGPNHGQASASDNISLPPTSPNISLPATSPARGLGANMSEIDLSSPLNYGTPSSMGSIRTPRSGIRGTPLRARPDIRTDKKMRQVAIGGGGVSTKRAHEHLA